MNEMEFPVWLARYQESAAYHEAGHIIAAAIQEMPLRDRGIHVDPNGSGIAYYWRRVPGDLARSRGDQLERMKTIIALHAGSLAQARFFPDCPADNWHSDGELIAALLKEMYPNDAAAREHADNGFRQGARRLVDQHWSIIAALATTVLSKPWTPQPPIEIKQNWSRGKASLEKCLTAAEVAELLDRFGVRAVIQPDSART